MSNGILKGGEVKPLAYKMTRIKKSDIQKDVVDATIGFLNSKKDSMTLHLHVSNNDIAYKYEMSRPKKDNPKSVIIYNEVSGFNFPEKTTTFLCPQITPMTGWERTKPSYEEEYTPDAPQTPRQIMNNSIARKKEMAWMKKIGVVGIKVDFFGGDKQETMKLYEDILSDANDYGLEVIFHGCTMPRGWERMYPNYVSSEAALASENVYFTDYHAKKEAFEMTMHPFSRNAVASFDWGGVMMNKYFSKDNKSRHQRYTSDVFEMATAITNQSSVNCICLYPNNLQDVPQWELDWLKNVPTA